MPDDERNQDDSGQTGQGGSGDAPQYVTEAQLNKAITSRFAAFEKKITNQNEAAQKATVESVGSLLDEKLAGLKPPQKDADGQTGGDGDGQAGPDAATAAKLAGLEKQNQALQKRLDESEAKAAEKERKARDVTLRGTLGDALSEHGIEGKRALHAIGYLIDASKRVHLEDDGETVLFRDEDGTDVDLKTGLADWAKSDDAKLYQAPTGATGSGARHDGGNGRPAGGTKGGSESDIGQRLFDALSSGQTE